MAAQKKIPTSTKRTVVLDPNGLLVGGRNYPQGTDVARIPATDAHVKAWKRFKQIGDEPDDAAPAAEATGGEQ